MLPEDDNVLIAEERGVQGLLECERGAAGGRGGGTTGTGAPERKGYSVHTLYM